MQNFKDFLNVFNEKYICSICNVTCDTIETFKSHCEGKKHLKKAQLISLSENQSNFVPTSINSLGNDNDSYCSICDIKCVNKNQLLFHNEGKQHKLKVIKTEKLNKQNQESSPYKRKSQDIILTEQIPSENTSEDSCSIKTKKVNDNFSFCNICKININSELFQEHFNGLQHASNVLKVNAFKNDSNESLNSSQSSSINLPKYEDDIHDNRAMKSTTDQDLNIEGISKPISTINTQMNMFESLNYPKESEKKTEETKSSSSNSSEEDINFEDAMADAFDKPHKFDINEAKKKMIQPNRNNGNENLIHANIKEPANEYAKERVNLIKEASDLSLLPSNLSKDSSKVAVCKITEIFDEIHNNQISFIYWPNILTNGNLIVELLEKIYTSKSQAILLVENTKVIRQYLASISVLSPNILLHRVIFPYDINDSLLNIAEYNSFNKLCSGHAEELWKSLSYIICCNPTEICYYNFIQKKFPNVKVITVISQYEFSIDDPIPEMKLSSDNYRLVVLINNIEQQLWSTSLKYISVDYSPEENIYRQKILDEFEEMFKASLAMTMKLDQAQISEHLATSTMEQLDSDNRQYIDRFFYFTDNLEYLSSIGSPLSVNSTCSMVYEIRKHLESLLPNEQALVIVENPVICSKLKKRLYNRFGSEADSESENSKKPLTYLKDCQVEFKCSNEETNTTNIYSLILIICPYNLNNIMELYRQNYSNQLQFKKCLILVRQGALQNKIEWFNSLQK